MKIHTLLLVVGIAVIASFIALNLNAIMTPTTITFGVAAIQAPLGFFILGLMLLFGALFIVLIIYLKKSGFFKEPHRVRESHARQEPGNNNESSHFTKMRELLEVELKKQTNLHSESTAMLLSRLDQLDGALFFATNGLDRRIM